MLISFKREQNYNRTNTIRQHHGTIYNTPALFPAPVCVVLRKTTDIIDRDMRRCER
jgi:hypothetical protein